MGYRQDRAIPQANMRMGSIENGGREREREEKTKRLLSIVSVPGVCGGDPTFEGSRLQPKQIIYRLLYEPESALEDYPYIEQDLRTLLDIIHTAQMLQVCGE